MNSWDIRSLELRPHSPEVLSTTGDARAVALELAAGDSLRDHQVHEGAWVTVIDGEVVITTTAGEEVAGSAGLMVEFAPDERHAVRARTTARLLLLLTPWPGRGHPRTAPQAS
jgi:quercetin dioxygenase-like cupin family protein